MNTHNKHKRRGITRPGQEGMKRSHVAEGEVGPLFIIKTCRTHDVCPKLPYRLFLRRIKGYKFKKGFSDKKYAEIFANRYLELCCQNCKAQGIVQKVLNVGGIYGGYSNFPHCQNKSPYVSGQRKTDQKGQCLNCKTIHHIGYDKHVKILEPSAETTP